MIFIWTGRGWSIPGSLILGLCLWFCMYNCLLASEPPLWSMTLVFALSGLFCVGLGMHARFSPARLVRDPATGIERFKRPSHSAYWIRAEYWGLLYLGLATWMQTVLHATPPYAGNGG